MFKTFTKSLLAIAIVSTACIGTSFNAYASGDGEHEMEHQKWSFNGLRGTYDRDSMQRGYQVYREVCASCHALEHLSFRHLGDKGAPFYDENYPNPNDNPVVKAFAKDWDIADIDADSGDEISRPGIPADKFPLIYPNEPAARASNGGGLPPDLSIITKARTGGADYVYAILTGFHEAPHDVKMAEGMYYNVMFPGNQIGMAPPLADGLIEYAPVQHVTGHGAEQHVETVAAPEATVEQMARDVTEFLTWAGDPKMEARKKLGFATFLYLMLFSLLLFFTYKEVWRGVKH
jgi:ubiquinol-cytochrome c reductase cytochrome c1 subunit